MILIEIHYLRCGKISVNDPPGDSTRGSRLPCRWSMTACTRGCNAFLLVFYGAIALSNKAMPEAVTVDNRKDTGNSG